MTKRSKSIKPGDLVILEKLNKIDSMVIWATWSDEDYSIKELLSWPMIVGRIRRGEVVLVVDVYRPVDGPLGVKVCTANGTLGWIFRNFLRKLDGDLAET